MDNGSEKGVDLFFNMNILKFIVFLGVINIIFGVVWKSVFTWPVAILLTVLKIDYIGKYVVRIFGTYILVMG